MCGIIGYIGKKDALPVLLAGLKQLEYRGYDSAGVCIYDGRRLVISKCSGKIKKLIALTRRNKSLKGASLGIGHSRWATHGAPTNGNAHPHIDCSGDFAVVHNGIIENYNELKASLAKRGHKFRSDTDTEVIAHLVEEYYNGDFESAVLKAIKKLRGAYAIGIVSRYHPDKLIGVKKESPLILGLSATGNFIASDVTAVLAHTKKVVYLEENEIGILTDREVRVIGLDGKEIKKGVSRVKWDVKSAQKSGYAHFMLKEISEQPAVIRQIMSSRLRGGSGIIFDSLNIPDRELLSFKDITILACGTAYHAGLIGKYLIESFCRIPVTVDLSSEFRYRDSIVTKRSLILAISQSGETADTIAAVKEAKSRGARVISICNVVGSSLTRISDGVLYTYAGPEISVASTKAYTAQLAMLYLFAFYLAGRKGFLDRGRRIYLLERLKGIPALQERILDTKKTIHELAKRHHNFGSFLYLGRNLNYPTALEGALKLKEISYIPAEGYPAGEMKHGPIALIDEYRAVVCIAPQSGVYEKMISNIQEISARKGRLIIVATEGNRDIERFTKELVYIPPAEEVFSPLIAVLPLQLLAYYIAVERGCDVDQPRNLAKSVTVE